MPFGHFPSHSKRDNTPIVRKNICFVKLSYSTADNQGTAYLLNIPSQEQAAKDSAWAPLLDQPTNSPPGCCTASLHPSQPTSPVQHTEQRAVVCSQGLLKPQPCSTDLFASLECNHNIAEATKSLARFGSLFLSGKGGTAPNPVLRQDIHWFMWVDGKIGPIFIYSYIHRHQA